VKKLLRIATVRASGRRYVVGRVDFSTGRVYCERMSEAVTDRVTGELVRIRLWKDGLVFALADVDIAKDVRLSGADARAMVAQDLPDGMRLISRSVRR